MSQRGVPIEKVADATRPPSSSPTNVYRDAQGHGYLLRVSVGKLGTTKQETDLLIDQIHTISKPRLMGDKPLAELSRAHMKRVEDALRASTQVLF